MGKVGGHYFAFLVSSQLVNEMYKLLQRQGVEIRSQNELPKQKLRLTVGHGVRTVLTERILLLSERAPSFRWDGTVVESRPLRWARSNFTPTFVTEHLQDSIFSSVKMGCTFNFTGLWAEL